MKKRLPIWIGLLSAVMPAVWISVVKTEQIPRFIERPIASQAGFLDMFFFTNSKTEPAIEHFLFFFYCAALGTMIGKLCRLILRWKSDHAR